jgi:hypothetical protein
MSVDAEVPRWAVLLERLLFRMLMEMPQLHGKNRVAVYLGAYAADRARDSKCHFAADPGVSDRAAPVNWFGRHWGQSHLQLRAMSRRYLNTSLKIWFERLLILDDLLADRAAPSEIK